jgi:hypothetical protein
VGGGTVATLRRRERRQRQRLRLGLLRTPTGPHPSDTGVGAGQATPPATEIRPVACVPPIRRPGADVGDAPTSQAVTPDAPTYYAPSLTLTLHPDTINAATPQPERYLYLTPRFLNRLRRGFVQNPIPLSLITIPINTEDFPAIPALVFGPMLGPGGSNVILYDQP